MKTPSPITLPSFLSDLQHCPVIILLHNADANSALRTVWKADAMQTLTFFLKSHLDQNSSCTRLLTADQTWIWSYLFVLVHTPMSFLLFIAYYSCTHLQALNNRINYFAGFIILFHKKVSSLLVTNARKPWKQTPSLLFYHRNMTD